MWSPERAEVLFLIPGVVYYNTYTKKLYFFMGCVYQAYNKINGKSYIGKTKKVLVIRMQEHKYAIKRKKSFYFQHALNKHGFSNFKWIELFISNDDKELCRMEKHFISFINTKFPHGYNLTDGGDGTVGVFHKPVSEETKRRISEANKGNKYRLGYKASITTRKKMSDYRTGRSLGPCTEERRLKLKMAKKGKKRKPFTEEAKRNMSLALLGNTRRRGKKASFETCQKISVSMKERRHTNECKQKMSELAKLRWANNKNSWNVINRPVSSQTREKLSRIMSLRWATKKQVII